MESLVYMEKEYKNVIKKNESLVEQLEKIKIAVKKEKDRNKN